MRTIVLVALTLLLCTFGGCRKKTPSELLAEAEQLLQERQNALAVVKLQNLVEKHPDDPTAVDARLLLAQYYVSLQQWDPALGHLREAYEKSGVGTDRGDKAMGGQVYILSVTGRFDEALTTLNAAIDKAKQLPDPNVAKSFEAYRADLQVNQSGTTETIILGLRHWREVMLNDSDPAQRGQSREKLANYYRQLGAFKDSNGIYDEYIAKYADDPTTPHLVLAQAINLRFAGEQEEGEKLFTEGEKLMLTGVEQELNQESRATRLSDLARYNQTMGRFDRAEELLRRIMAENAGKRPAIVAQFGIAQLWLEAFEFDKSFKILEQIKAENAGTSIAQEAEQMLLQAKAGQVNYNHYMEQVRQQEEAEKTGARDGSATAPAGS